MNKKELIEYMAQAVVLLGVKPDEVALGFEGAMVVFGLKESTRDIDLDVPLEVYNWYTSRGFVEKEGLLGKYIDLNEVVSIHLRFTDKTVMIDGVCCHHPKVVMDFYKQFQQDKRRNPLKREQDARAVTWLKEYALAF